MRRLIDEVSKHKIILLTTRITKEKLERALELSKKTADYYFEDVDKLEREVRISIKMQPNPGIT